MPTRPGPDRLLRPQRPDFDDFVYQLDDLSDPAEALERATSRGWLSPEEIPRPDRGFARGLHCARCDGTASRDRLRCDRCAGAMRLRASRAPTRVRTVAALAADPQGIRQAEALAFEALARFVAAESALLERPPKRLPTAVVWCPVEPWALGRALITEQYLVSSAYRREAWLTDMWALLPAGLDPAVLDALEPRIRDCYKGLNTWQPPALPNPFEPLAALWELGYGQVGLSVNAVYLLLPDG